MSEKTRTILKTYFETGDTPTQAEFIHLIDSFANFLDDFTDKYIKVELNSAQILDSFTTPIEAVATPGAGKILVPTLIVAKTNYGTVTYTTNTSMWLMWDSATTVLDSINLARTEDYIQMEHEVSLNAVLANFENKNLTFKTLTGNPTAGDGTMTFYLWYKILTL